MSVALEPSRQIRKFNPGAMQSDAEIVEQFVVRIRELGTVLDVLRGNIDSRSCQHVLLVAPRGRGKTMLLARVAAELRADGELSKKLLPVRFMEESQEIFDLGDFWLEALFYIAREQAIDDPVFSDELKETHRVMAAEWRDSEFESRARAKVLEVADRLGKQLVFMIENLQTLSGDVDQDFGWKLRAVLQSDPQIILLATSTSRFKGLDDADEPFFELFRELRLDPLDTEECLRLWHVVSGDAVASRQVRPLQILTGGNPRLLVIVAEFARHRSLRQLMDELVRLIDDHTEYFRGHLERFAKTERRVYLAAIDLWQASTTAEIAARARLDLRVVSTLLGRLVQRGALLMERSGNKRVYVTAERLYSIYYKLRRQRDEASIVRNLINFMTAFYSDLEMVELAGRIRLEAADSLVIRRGVERAIADSPSIERYRLTGDRPIERSADSEVNELQLAAARTMFEKGATLGRVEDFQAELEAYDELLDRFGDSEATKLQEVVAMALVNKGIALGRNDDFRAALAAYDDVVERFGASGFSKLQILVAFALFNKACELGQINDRHDAIATYDRLIERCRDSDLPKLQATVFRSYANKAADLIALGRAEKALQACEELDKRVAKVSDDLKVEFGGRAAALKTEALLAMGRTTAAMDQFRVLYDTFLVEGGSTVDELLTLVAKLIAAGANERDLLGILSGDNSKSDALLPLLVALRRRIGEIVRAPPEVQEVAEDVGERIESMQS